MTALVTGCTGLLGSEVMAEFGRRGIKAAGLLRAELDITDGLAVRSALAALRPDAVIHCAACTAVDAAERDPAACMAVNVQGTANIAAACAEVGAKLIYPSTDYVFDGSGSRPWKPGDAPGPLNVYGESKYRGELAAAERTEKLFIVRTSWLFGKNGRNFADTMLGLARSGRSLRAVCDEIGRPTSASDLAVLLCGMAAGESYGIYHASGSGEFASWYDIAAEALRLAGLEDVPLSPITAEEYGAAARRPKNSRLDCSSAT